MQHFRLYHIVQRNDPYRRAMRGCYEHLLALPTDYPRIEVQELGFGIAPQEMVINVASHSGASPLLPYAEDAGEIYRGLSMIGQLEAVDGGVAMVRVGDDRELSHIGTAVDDGIELKGRKELDMLNRRESLGEQRRPQRRAGNGPRGFGQSPLELR